MPITNGQYRRPQLRNSNINYRFGWFFVTFQVFENKSELGAVVGEECVLNELGNSVKNLIETLPQYNPEVLIDSFVVMPNHLHLVIKIEDHPTNEEHHLGKIMRKLKSLAAREYRLLKERGLARDIGTKLWQENYWEKIVTNHEQLKAIRTYILNNPKRWSIDRFGPVTTYSIGNLALLNEPFVAFVASQDARAEKLVIRECPRGATPPYPENNAKSSETTAYSRGAGLSCPAPVISTFTSPQEREALKRILAKSQPFIAVYPGGIPATLPQEISKSVEEGRALLISPVETGTGVNKQRAIWCNEYVIRKAAKIWCGSITAGGTLESILKGTIS